MKPELQGAHLLKKWYLKVPIISGFSHKYILRVSTNM
jgi:hypothetical protein